VFYKPGLLCTKYFLKYYFQLGFQFNAEGRMGKWWTNDTIKQFEQRQKCMIDQYNKYHYDEAQAYVS
jgi:predicted metalloendopeptidase